MNMGICAFFRSEMIIDHSSRFKDRHDLIHDSTRGISAVSFNEYQNWDVLTEKVVLYLPEFYFHLRSNYTDHIPRYVLQINTSDLTGDLFYRKVKGQN